MDERKFIDKIIKEGKLNLRKTYKINGKRGVILPYSSRKYNAIKNLQDEINKIAMKQREPFVISTLDSDLAKGEERFKYL